VSELQDNPYSALLGTLRRDSADRSVAPWRFGILRSLSPPAVDIGGQTVTAGVSINPMLRGAADPGDRAVPGDRVVLLQSSDGQEYVILCKAVSA